MNWKTEIEDWKEGDSFVDIQLKGPYQKWRHTHEFVNLKGGVWLKDRVVYALPFGKLGALAGNAWVRRDVGEIFKFRNKKTRELLV